MNTIDELVEPQFTGMVVLAEQVIEKRRPVPYIVAISPTGLVTIGWSVSMKPVDDLELVHMSKVGVKPELVEQQRASTDQTILGRSLKREADIEQAWYQEYSSAEQVSLMLMDALEVKMISSDLDSDEESLLNEPI